MKKILIVDDDNQVRSTLSRFLRAKSYHTDEASSGQTAIEKATSHQFDIVILDLIMPDASGLDVLRELRKITPKTKVIMLTGFATIDSTVEAIKRGASDYLAKPCEPEELDTSVRLCLEETRFDECIQKADFDFTLRALSNPIRRKTIKLLDQNMAMHLMNMTRELGIEDHRKVLFHLKILKDSALIEQDKQKLYTLTKEGKKTLACLKALESQLAEM
jgi:DNA-binding response OmpR family regulator